MGVNNRQRRAAKQRKRARQQPSSSAPGGQRSEWGQKEQTGQTGQTGFGFTAGPRFDAAQAYNLAELQLTAVIRRLGKRKHDEEELQQQVESLLRRVTPVPRDFVATVLADVLGRLADTLAQGGWGSSDLEQLVRRLDVRLLPMLGVVLHQGTGTTGTRNDLAAGLRLAELFAGVPLLDADAVAKGAASRGSGQEHPKLARARALLAKAESTEFDEEAEALNAKAQQLIARYALGQLLDEASSDGQRSGSTATVRRLWLDAPYVRAKAALVDQVARANRCRTAVAEQHAFSLVVGAPVDLDVVELLVTSLLVQASSAMLRYGRSLDGRGTSRTRSFRQSFLLAFAARIGERLRAATESVATEAMVTGDVQRLLPVLRDHEVRVSEAFEAMVPHTVGRATRIKHGEGWTAGRAAADLAQLDVNGKLGSG